MNTVAGSGAIRCEACGAIFRNLKWWEALRAGHALTSATCLKCEGPGPFSALSDADLEAVRKRGGKDARAVFWALLAVGALAFVAWIAWKVADA